MVNNNLPQVGDVIVSDKFVYGSYADETKKVICVDGETTQHKSGIPRSQNEMLQIAAQTGKIPEAERVIELGAFDASRAEAKFVVEVARMTGGGGGRLDPFPDGWKIDARRLANDGSYDQSGEVITFYMSGSFAGLIDPKHVKVIGKMQHQFV